LEALSIAHCPKDSGYIEGVHPHLSGLRMFFAGRDDFEPSTRHEPAKPNTDSQEPTSDG